MMAIARPKGLTLVELLVAMALSAFLLGGLVASAATAVRSMAAQRGLAEVQESGRFANRALAAAIRGAGYSPEPWNPVFDLSAITSESRANANGENDELGVQRWSDRNCHDLPNPNLDEAGNPRFYQQQKRFFINSSGNLALVCRYGPSEAELTTQINHLGLVEGVEAFELLFALDSDDDGSADQWVAAQDWIDEADVQAIRFNLVVASAASSGEPPAGSISMDDRSFAAPDDGHVRRTYAMTVGIRGRL